MLAQFGANQAAFFSALAKAIRSKICIFANLAMVGVLLSSCTVPLREGSGSSNSAGSRDPLGDLSIVDSYTRSNYRKMAGEALSRLFRLPIF